MPQQLHLLQRVVLHVAMQQMSCMNLLCAPLPLLLYMPSSGACMCAAVGQGRLSAGGGQPSCTEPCGPSSGEYTCCQRTGYCPALRTAAVYSADVLNLQVCLAADSTASEHLSSRLPVHQHDGYSACWFLQLQRFLCMAMLCSKLLLLLLLYCADC